MIEKMPTFLKEEEKKKCAELNCPFLASTLCVSNFDCDEFIKVKIRNDKSVAEMCTLAWGLAEQIAQFMHKKESTTPASRQLDLVMWELHYRITGDWKIRDEFVYKWTNERASGNNMKMQDFVDKYGMASFPGQRFNPEKGWF